MAKKDNMAQRVKIARGMSVSKAKEKKMEKKPGGSNVGNYAEVSKIDFAGKAGGSPQGSYPINTKERGKSALKLAHNAPNPAGIKAKVYSKYPSLKKGAPKKK